MMIANKGKQVTVKIPMSKREAYLRGFNEGIKAADFELFRYKAALEVYNILEPKLKETIITTINFIHNELEKLVTKQAIDES